MLTVKRPSPTTVQYTVSTRAPASTINVRIQRIATGLLRIAAGVLSLCILWSHLRISHGPLQAYSDIAPIVGLPAQSFILLPWTYAIPICFALLYISTRRFYIQESLLVIRGLGVQISTSSATYLSTANTRFIPTSAMQDIFLHEAFKGFEVRFYLAIVVEGEETLVVVFPKTLPKRKLLEQVWRGTKGCLYESSK